MRFSLTLPLAISLSKCWRTIVISFRSEVTHGGSGSRGESMAEHSSTSHSLPPMSQAPSSVYLLSLPGTPSIDSSLNNNGFQWRKLLTLWNMGAFSIGLTSSADSGSWDATRAGTVPIVGRGPKHHNITMFSFHWSNRFACTDLERITRAELLVWGVASTCLSKGMSRHLV